MKLLRGLLLAVIVLSSSLAFARKGSLVGNGAGWVESNAIYAYQIADKLIASCIASVKCRIDSRELAALQAIQAELYRNKMKAASRVVVEFGEKADELFNKSCGVKHRVACSFGANQPIYLNGTILYDRRGRPAVDLPGLIALIVHEVGHQVGYDNHKFLDHLGSRVREMAAADIIEVEAPEGIDSFGAVVVNYGDTSIVPEVNIESNELFYSFGDEIFSSPKIMDGCPENAEPGAFKVGNLHWVDKGKKSFSGGKMKLRLVGWTVAKCFPEGSEEQMSDSVLLSEFVINIHLEFDSNYWKMESAELKSTSSWLPNFGKVPGNFLIGSALYTSRNSVAE